MKRFTNKVIIVTGASRGLGQGYAVAFAREGAKVAGVDIGDQSQTRRPSPRGRGRVHFRDRRPRPGGAEGGGGCGGAGLATGRAD